MHASPERVGQAPKGLDERLVSLVAPASFEAEQYRSLRHRVELMHRDTGLRVIGVTSPASGEGKTITAINLTGALGQSPEAQALLVETDLRRPGLTVGDRPRPGALGRPGLVDAILGPELTLDHVIQRHPRFNLWVLQAGSRPTAPYEVLRSPRLGALLEEARQRYPYIVLDMPPLVPVPDWRLIGRWVDGFLIVVAAHKTPRKLLEDALDLLDPTKVLGLVFNGDDRPLSRYYRYYYHASSRGSHHRSAGRGAATGHLTGCLWSRQVPSPGATHGPSQG